MSLLPPSWTNTVSLFRQQESLTRPVNRHTSLIRLLTAARSSFLSPRDSHTHARTHTHTQQKRQQTKAQRSPSEIFNHTTQFALRLLSFVILHLLVCLAVCSLSSSVVSAAFPSFPSFSSSVQLFPLSPAPGQNVPSTSLWWLLVLFSNYLALEHPSLSPQCSIAVIHSSLFHLMLTFNLFLFLTPPNYLKQYIC